MAVSYFMGIPGIIKITEEVLNFIAFMCVACASFITSRADAFLAASIGAFIITAILLCIYVLDLQDKLPVPWIKIQFFYCAIWGLFYFITAALVIDEGAQSVKVGLFTVPFPSRGPYIAGGVFGLFASAAYFVDAFFKYQKQM